MPDQSMNQFLLDAVDMAEAELDAGELAKARHHLQTIRLALQLGRGVPTVRDSPAPDVRSGGRPRTEEGKQIEAAILEILSNAGGPVHIQDLLQGLRDKGVKPPGQGTAANLIAHLRRMDNVKRSNRGMYELVK